MKKILLIFSLMAFYACGGGGDPVTQELNTFIDSGPEEGSTTGPDVTFEFSSNKAGATFMCMTEGWHTCTSPLNVPFPEGSMVFMVKAVLNGSEDSTPAERNWMVDDTPPETTITSGPGGASGSTVGPAPFTAFLQFESNEASTFECNFNAEGWVPCASVMSYPDLPDGSYLFEVKATDAVGNEDTSPDVYTWIVAPIL